MLVRMKLLIVILGLPLLAWAQNPAQPTNLACTAPSSWFPATPQPVNASLVTNCDFHLWSWQEFLWLTQPASTSPGFRNFQTLANPADLFVANPRPYPGAVSAIPAMKPRGRKPPSQNMGAIDQAGGLFDVLVDQHNNPVYYTSHVNQVYYDFIVANKFNYMANVLAANPNLNFPTHGPGALEIKSSWRIASMGGVTYIPNQQDFITTFATVEIWKFDPVKKVWVDTLKTQQAIMALVGMHVVGTAPGHPEFIWATFEHQDNAPTCAATAGGAVGPVNKDTGNPWSFYPGNLDCAGNKNCNQAASAASPGKPPAGSSNRPDSVCLVVPAGGGNPVNVGNITTLNASVRSQLAPTDVRRNYYYGGSVWTNQGALPITKTNQAGSLQVENTTMETYFQGQGMNCLTCHNTQPITPKFGTQPKNIYLSHLLKMAVALPAKPGKAKK